ncbi:caspase family protein, partial [Salinispira pacifica]
MRFRRVMAAVCMMLLAAIPIFARDSAGDGQALHRFGLFIGANDGGPGRTRLLYAVSDSRSMADVMYEVGGLQRGDSILAVDPTPAELSQKLAQMRALIETRKEAAPRGEQFRTEFILYYSGHSDEQGLLLGGSRFGYRELHDALRSMEVDVSIAVLDSCDSGAFIRLKGGQRVAPFLVDESTKMKGQVYLTSSSEDEASQESDAIGGSFFTQSLVSGLRGAADYSRDGKVTIDEA